MFTIFSKFTGIVHFVICDVWFHFSTEQFTCKSNPAFSRILIRGGKKITSNEEL